MRAAEVEANHSNHDKDNDVSLSVVTGSLNQRMPMAAMSAVPKPDQIA